MRREIGERFTLYGVHLEVKDDRDNDCEGCFFYDGKCPRTGSSDELGDCRGLIFEEVKIKEENRMKKSELKTGMWVTTRTGDRYLVIKDADTTCYGHQDVAFMRSNSFMLGNHYDENLKFVDTLLGDQRQWDIVKVEGETDGTINSFTYEGRNLKILWEETKAITLTLDELIEKAGYSKGEIIVKLEE